MSSRTQLSVIDLRDMLILRLLRMNERFTYNQKDVILRQLYRAANIPVEEGAREALFALAFHYGIPQGVPGA